MNKLYTILFILVCNLIYAQCPPGTWGLDIAINPDQYPEETSFVVLNTEGDTLMEGGPFMDIVDYQPQYISTCTPVDTFILILKDHFLYFEKLHEKGQHFEKLLLNKYHIFYLSLLLRCYSTIMQLLNFQ